MEDTARLSIVRDSTDRLVVEGPVDWAVGQLREALSARGIRVGESTRVEDTPDDGLSVLVAGATSATTQDLLRRADASLPATAESLALVPGRLNGRSVVLATGSDARGLVYAVLELADRVVHRSDPLGMLQLTRPIVEQPANPIRGVMRLFVSDVEDKPWFYDRSFWQHYLSMLVGQRFNRFHLAFGIGHDFLRNVRDAYFLFPYPFLVSVPGHDVRVVGLPEEERERNLRTLRFIGEEASARGLQFQLGLWTHAYEWIDSPDANYTIEGLTSENHASYCRDALRTVLQACPAIGGVTFRVHGESGVPEGSYGFWKTVFDGVVQCGRRIAIDLHPKGVDREMIRVALQTGLPVTLSPKYTAEHMGLPAHQASIRPVEREPSVREGDQFVARLMSRSAGDLRYTRYGYGDFLTEDRDYGVFFRIWPGTQRLLLWGDPSLAAGFGRHGSFGGCLGVEIFEPLSFKGRRGSGAAGGRDAYLDASLRPEVGDWEKYLYTYRLFGRLLYNPDADPETWRRFLRHEFGDAAAPVEVALGSASRILPLVTTAHHPSAANNRFWPEIYSNMPIVDEGRPHPYRDTPSPRRFGTVSALDPALFAGIDEFAEELVRGERSGKYSPLRVARWLMALADTARLQLPEAEARISDRGLPSFRRLAVDVAIQTAIGRFFAQKLRAGVAYALYARTEDPERLREALDAYRFARAAWVEATEHARVYRTDITFGGEPFLRGHWADRLAEIDADIGNLEAVWTRAQAHAAPAVASRQTAAAERRSLDDLDGEPTEAEYLHAPPDVFEPGRPVTIRLDVRPADPRGAPFSVCLHYRHVNQADTDQVLEMNGGAEGYQATIPGDYTDTPYPLLYFFELRNSQGTAWLYPGLSDDLSSQPYFVIRQEANTPWR